MLLQEAQITNHSEMVFHILGHIGTNITSQNIMFDLCLVLQSMNMPQYTALCAKVENYVQDRQEAVSLMSSNEWPRQCRLSLRTTLKSLRRENQMADTVSPGNENIPPDLPIHPVAWASKSSTEQQVTLLIISLQPQYLNNKFDFITTLFGNIVNQDVNTYVIKHTRIQGMIFMTMSLLQPFVSHSPSNA